MINCGCGILWPLKIGDVENPSNHHLHLVGRLTKSLTWNGAGKWMELSCLRGICSATRFLKAEIKT
jgi:hypothetical protein